MLKKGTVVLFMVVLVFSLSISGFAKDAKEARVEGRITNSDKSKSMFSVRTGDTAVGGGVQKTVHYDASTKWVSQYHGDKKVNTIDPSEVKDNDYVICTGSYDDKGNFQATMISKRLSHNP